MRKPGVQREHARLTIIRYVSKHSLVVEINLDDPFVDPNVFVLNFIPDFPTVLRR